MQNNLGNALVIHYINEMKEKKIRTTINAEKALKKFKNTFMIKKNTPTH